MNQHQGWEAGCQLKTIFATAGSGPRESAGEAMHALAGESGQGAAFAGAVQYSEGESVTATSAEAPEPTKASEPSAATNEQALVAAARNGDTVAFGELIERHRKECLKRAMMMIRNRSDAEDEVQNAFCK